MRTAFFVILLGLAVGCASEPDTPAIAPYPSQAVQLVQLLNLNNPQIGLTARALAEQGNSYDKRMGEQQLVGLAEMVARDDWRQAQLPTIQRLHPGRLTESDVNRLLDELQKRNHVRVYDAMTILGGELIFAHCKAVAKDESRSASQRQLAVAVLAAHDLTEKRPAPQPWGMPGQQPQPQGQHADTRFDTPVVKGGRIDNVNQVVDALRPYFSQCYRQSMQRNGHFAAWIMLDAAVVGNGSVSGVRVSGDESVPLDMNQCLQAVVSQARFAPPVGGSANVEIPLYFTAKPPQ